MSQYEIELGPYLQTYDLLKQAIEGLSKEQLKWKESPDKWSVTEVLSHVTDHHIVVSFRIRDILAGTSARLPAFDQDSWVSGSKANDGSAVDILDVFQALLLYNSQLYKRLSPGDWQKSAVNFRGETVTVEAAFKGFIAHVHKHIGQISRIKQAAGIDPTRERAG